MVRDRQHGPVIELNRISVRKQSAAADPTGTGNNPGGKVVTAMPSTAGGCKPVFAQMVGKVHLLGPESLLLPHRVWKVQFVYSEKATKFCKISTLLLSYVVQVKSKVETSQNFVAFLEYMNFRIRLKTQNVRPFLACLNQ